MTLKKFKPFILVIDDFYKEPEKVLAFAKSQEYYEPPGVTGCRSRNVYHEKGIRKKLEKLIGIKIDGNRMKEDEWNGVFYATFSEGKFKEIPAIHTDPLLNDISVVIYLTPGISPVCGTSFWKHKRTGVYHEATQAEARRLGMSIKALRDELENDSLMRSKWIQLDQIAYKYNRMIAFPSGLFHSASKHFGKDAAEGRIIQVFRLEVDWDGFKGK